VQQKVLEQWEKKGRFTFLTPGDRATRAKKYVVEWMKQHPEEAPGATGLQAQYRFARGPDGRLPGHRLRRYSWWPQAKVAGDVLTNLRSDVDKVKTRLEQIRRTFPAMAGRVDQALGLLGQVYEAMQPLAISFDLE